MTRSTLTSTNRAETQKKEARQVEFAEFAFPSGTIRVCNADRHFTWGGFTWLGDGTLVEPGTIEETPDLNPRRYAFLLSALDPSLVTKVMTDQYQFALAKFYVGWCDANWALVADPHVLGDTLLMSNAVLSLDERSGTIELSAESWTIFSERDSAVLATPQSQRLRYPGDSGQDRMAAIVTTIVEWNGQPQRIGTGAVGTRVDGLIEYDKRD